jgi:hypothetical protein
MPTGKLTKPIIEAAIDGFEAQTRNIDGQIAELRAMLTGGSETIAEEAPAKPGGCLDSRSVGDDPQIPASS